MLNAAATLDAEIPFGLHDDEAAVQTIDVGAILNKCRHLVAVALGYSAEDEEVD